MMCSVPTHHSASMAFYFAGGCLLLACLLACPLRLLARREGWIAADDAGDPTAAVSSTCCPNDETCDVGVADMAGMFEFNSEVDPCAAEYWGDGGVELGGEDENQFVVGAVAGSNIFTGVTTEQSPNPTALLGSTIITASTTGGGVAMGYLLDATQQPIPSTGLEEAGITPTIESIAIASGALPSNEMVSSTLGPIATAPPNAPTTTCVVDGLVVELSLPVSASGQPLSSSGGTASVVVATAAGTSVVNVTPSTPPTVEVLGLKDESGLEPVFEEDEEGLEDEEDEEEEKEQEQYSLSAVAAAAAAAAGACEGTANETAIAIGDGPNRDDQPISTSSAGTTTPTNQVSAQSSSSNVASTRPLRKQWKRKKRSARAVVKSTETLPVTEPALMACDNKQEEEKMDPIQ